MSYLFKLKKHLQREHAFLLFAVAAWAIIFFGLFDSPLGLFANNWPIIVIAFFSAMIANATAVGGGFIFLPLFTFLYDLSAIQSLKLALSTQAFGMTSGALSWPRQLIIWRYACFAGIASGIGMVLGTFLWLPSNELIHVYFGYASIAIGIVLVVEALMRKPQNNNEHRAARPIDKITFFLICVFGGLITAWVSIGIGEIVAMWMLFKARYSIASSVATGVAVLAFCSILGFAFHIQIGGIVWQYLIFTSIGVILGGRVGAKLGATLAGTQQTSGKEATITLRKKQIHDKPRAPDRPLKLFVALVILIDGIVVLWLKA